MRQKVRCFACFDKHFLPNTELHVDVGTENTHFDNLPAIVSLSKIPRPIHVDDKDNFRNTQTVESSHSGVKMRLRLGRGLHRHNLQPVMDFEDFLYNRTNGTPSDVFKKLGDVAAIYCRTIDETTHRNSVIPISLNNDIFTVVQGLSLGIIERLCSGSVFKKAARFRVKSSAIISTQCYPQRNTITGEFRATRIHDQVITWRLPDLSVMDSGPVAFNLETFAATCTCRYFEREKIRSSKLCSHIVGQLRRVIFLSNCI